MKLSKWVSGIASLFFLTIAVLYFTSAEDAENAFPVIVLFAIPLLQIVRINMVESAPLRCFNAACMLLYLVFFLVFWAVYSLYSHGLDRSISFWPLIFNLCSFFSTSLAVVFVIIALFVTWGILQSSNYPKIQELIGEMKEHRFLTICFFLLIFLCVTYLLAFALAFHDKSVRHSNRGGVGLHKNAEPYQNLTPDLSRKIYFQENFIADGANREILPIPGANCEETRIRHNSEALDVIIHKIRRDSINKCVRITLIGHYSENENTSNPKLFGSRLSHQKYNQKLCLRD